MDLERTVTLATLDALRSGRLRSLAEGDADGDARLAWYLETGRLEAVGADPARVARAVLTGDMLAGLVDVDLHDADGATIAIWVAPTLRGRGIARAAVALAAQEAEARGARTLVANVPPGDAASRRACEAAGLRPAGVDANGALRLAADLPLAS